MGPPTDTPAAETRADVETDHIDAADDGGPRSWGLAVRPLQFDLGLVGAEVGVAVGSSAAVTFEAGWLALAPSRAYGATLGVAIFPTRFAFHGFYVHPRLETWRASAGGPPRDAVGVGGLLGYQWTAPVGASLKLGGGLVYCTWLGSEPAPAPAVPRTGVLPELDVALGWVF